ncbi:LamG-like jellyroll fold domain-containing protein [Krasilnikovia sp. M28-CT-15]|uniref:LamG-like jellyroll fold domain-containing protein n=1 Tax=Krasilnikovia sp. M28-CT-15 TaxID=3373540 RepID=UPI0038768760
MSRAGHDRRARRLTRTAAALAAVGLAAAGVGGLALPATATTDPVPDPAQTLVAHYTFDGDGDTVLQDTSGHGHNLLAVTSRGGAITPIARATGHALAFPTACTVEPCPRIALRAASTPDLNPGTQPLRFGASIKLRHDQTSSGQNLVQKGYSAHSSQYKLQIDGLAGKPSCAMVDDAHPHIWLAKSSITVADGRWHHLECRRAGSTLTILVDAVARGTRTIPATLSVTNPNPLCIGSKGAYLDNDQYHGILSDVWISIG